MDKKGKEGLQELKQHGSRLFPFNIYPCTIPGDFPTGRPALAEKHGSDLCEKRLRSGPARDGQREREEGDIFVIPPGTLHALRNLRGYGMEYENIILRWIS